MQNDGVSTSIALQEPTQLRYVPKPFQTVSLDLDMIISLPNPSMYTQRGGHDHTHTTTNGRILGH